MDSTPESNLAAVESQRQSKDFQEPTASSATVQRKLRQVSMAGLDLLCLTCPTPCHSEGVEEWKFSIEDGVTLNTRNSSNTATERPSRHVSVRSRRSTAAGSVTVFQRRLQTLSSTPNTS